MSILDSAPHVVELVSRISVPPSTSLAGEFPIISIVCATDDVNFICDTLREFTDTQWVLLSEIIELCVASDVYPHQNTVWPYNDPQVAVDRCRTAATPTHLLCKSARASIIEAAQLHETTFPFIETPHFSMEGDTVYPPIRENSEESRQHNDGPFLTLLMPTLAIGSILMLAKNKICAETI